MAVNGIGSDESTGMDLPAHKRNYEGFLKILKWSTIVTIIISALVIYIIAN